jgi:leucyl aminopeptidase (aminopeptidase T)
LEIVESLVAQTLIAGGQPIPYFEFSEANDKALREAPLEYLRQEHTAELSLLNDLDVYIEAKPGFNPVEFLASGIPRERLIAAQEGRSSIYEAFSAGTWREVYVGQSSGIPTESYAEYSNAYFSDMSRNFWAAVSVTPAELNTIASRLTMSLMPGSHIHLNGPKNTDLRFTLSDDPVKITTGTHPEQSPGEEPAKVFLPAGEIAACVDPSSANGSLYIPVYAFRDEFVTGMTLQFENGVVTRFSAESGIESFGEFMDTQDEATRALSLVNIGFNPHSKFSEGSRYRSWEMNGVITAFLGDNTLYQCGHEAGNRLHPHIEGLTMTADGTAVVLDGQVQ